MNTALAASAFRTEPVHFAAPTQTNSATKTMKKLTLLIAATLLPLAGWSQTIVFQDNFTGSSKSKLNPTAASPGTLNGTNTAYEIASSKGATGSSITTGAMTIGGFSTTSGYCEAQALFTNTPIALTSAGQYIEAYYVFTDTNDVFNGNCTNNAQLSIGLYNSGGSAPTNGTFLWNGGLSANSNQVPTGAAAAWLGYCGEIAYSKAVSTWASAVYTRSNQTAANNLNQGLCPSSGNSGGINLGQTAGVLGQPTLTANSQYTVDLKIYYVNSTTLAVTNSIYVGSGVGGSVFSSGGFTAQNGGLASGVNRLTNSFDAVCIAFRPTAAPGSIATLKVNQVTVNTYFPAAPVITGLSNQTFVASTTGTVSPTVTAQPAAAYQWFVSTDSGATSNALAWATSSSLTLTNVQYSQDGYIYTLVAANSVGTNAASMTLSVIVPPSIAGLNNQSQNVGDNFSISPTVSGVPTPAVQWIYAGTVLTDGATVNGSTLSGTATSTLTFANGQAADSGTYWLVATNLAGVISNSMVLTISSTPTLPVLVGPTNITVIQGTNGTFSASASGLPVPTLQWLDNTQTPITAANNTTLVLTNVQYSQNGYIYYCVASNSVGSVTNSATLTVIVPPAITSQPVSLTVTNTQAAAFTVAATGVPTPTYQWYKNGSPISTGVNSTATNATLTFAAAGIADAGNYYVAIVNSAGSTNSATVTLKVNSAMAVAALNPANSATGICYDTPLYLTFSATPTLKNAGKIQIYNVTNPATPVDIIDLSLNLTNNATYAKNVQPYVIASDTFSNFPVIISGNQAAIYPHHGILTSNQTYYVTLDNGTFVDAAGANFAGISATNVWQFTTKTGGPANPTNIVVTADGSGDFVTVQGAVDSIAANNTTPTLISIRDGSYVEILNIRSKNNITLRGQSRNGTLIGYANNNNVTAGTHYRMSTKINANDIAFDNLTLTNRTPAGGSQAEALMLESKALRFILNNCTIASYQDTFLGNGGGQAQAYFNNSLVIGQFDYMWGGAVVFVTNCEMRTVYGTGGSWNLIATRTDNTATGTWPAYNGLASSNGFSFVNCFINKQTGVGIGNPTIADSNGTSNGVACWINCRIQKDYVTAGSVTNSELLWEYGNTNNDTGTTTNLGLTGLTTSDARYLAAANAVNWLYGWSPALAPNILTNPASQTVSNSFPATFTVAATGIPDPSYQWQHAGTNLSGATGPTLTIASAGSADAGTYDVIVTTSAGSVTSASATLTVTAPANTAPVFTAPPAGTNIVINAGVNLSVACTATDSDTPAQTLTFTLVSGPSGLSVTTNGTLTWRPTTAQANSTNTVKVSVTDNGTPNLSATNTFTVRVNALTAPAPVDGSASFSAGQFSISANGQLGQDYYLQAKTDLTSGTWTTVASTNSPASLPVILTDPNAGSQPAQFYRIVVGPPAP
jgi:Pectinesterase/Immunoglobulin I-set domain/Bacterial Ig-like domain